MSLNSKKKIKSSFICILVLTIFTIIITGIIIGCINMFASKESNYSISNNNQNIILENYPITHEDKFGGVYVKITIDDFNNLGFEYGDSVDVSFSNGVKLDDIPYYNGYYVDAGSLLVVSYPGYPYVKVGINYGDDIYKTLNLTDNHTCTIKLNQRGKYIENQKLRDIHYSDEQGEMSDIVFANFRQMKVGKLKDNFVYRGASPIDNTHNRAPIVDSLIKKENINYIIDLADNDEEITKFSQKEDFNSRYFMNLYNNNKVCVLSMDMQYKSDDFAKKLVNGLKSMASNDVPYYIHCQEGKDRTGYVCMVVEALAGATYNEIVDDYMETYKNYYSITKETDKDRYEIIKQKNIDDMLSSITGKEISELKTINIQEKVEAFLQKYGMTKDELSTLKSKICN